MKSETIALIISLLLPPIIVGMENTLFKRDKNHGARVGLYNTNGYSLEDVEETLEVVMNRFQKITTWGPSPSDCPTNGSCSINYKSALKFTAIAAANLNRRQGIHGIQLEIGVGWHTVRNYQVVRERVKYTFKLAAEANNVYYGTVTGVILTNHFGAYPLNELLEAINDNKNLSKTLSLNLGIFSLDCNILSLKALQPRSYPDIVEVIQSLDFIICLLHPAGNKSGRTMSDIVGAMGKLLLTIKGRFQEVNPLIRISGETVWPSQEVSLNGAIGSIQNMRSFWLEMTKWSQTNDFRVDPHAFDIGWTFNLKRPVQHYEGWWARVRNDSNGHDAFVEKITTIPHEESKLPLDHNEAIIWGLLGAIITVLIIGVAVQRIRLKTIQSQTQLLTDMEVEEFLNGKEQDGDESVEGALIRPYDRSYEIPKTSFFSDRTKALGSGAFGTVYRGKLEGREDDVAFKMTRGSCSVNDLKSLLSEIKIMIHVGNHWNVVSIIGAYTGEIKQGVIIIALELCCQGSLEKYLRTNKNFFTTIRDPNDPILNSPNQSPSEDTNNRIDVKDLMKYSYQIACGMEHIASKNVIHADLAIRNVLLTRQGIIKITDFGLSRRLYEYSTYIKTGQEQLPWRSMAIESLQHMQFSTKSDVWAYGISLWEIFSLGNTPYPGLNWTPDFSDQIKKGLRMSAPQHASPEIYDQMVECWNEDPERRPSFTALKQFFKMTLIGYSKEYQNLRNTLDTDIANHKGTQAVSSYVSVVGDDIVNLPP